MNIGSAGVLRLRNCSASRNNSFAQDDKQYLRHVDETHYRLPGCGRWTRSEGRPVPRSG
jgi:hypothetical protein